MACVETALYDKSERKGAGKSGNRTETPFSSKSCLVENGPCFQGWGVE